jgi:predicted hotdog family 3-hydroxylacyl-ACP dehydratase
MSKTLDQPNGYLSAAQIAALIPHAGSMCLLHEVTQYSEQSIVCKAVSHRLSTNPLRERNMLSSACGVEYAAQAMAIHGCLQTRAAQGLAISAPRGGRLASVRSVDFFTRRLDDIDSDLRIAATQIMGDANSMVYEFSVSANERVLLQGKATVILVAEGQS